MTLLVTSFLFGVAHSPRQARGPQPRSAATPQRSRHVLLNGLKPELKAFLSLSRDL